MSRTIAIRAGRRRSSAQYELLKGTPALLEQLSSGPGMNSCSSWGGAADIRKHVLLMEWRMDAGSWGRERSNGSLTYLSSMIFLLSIGEGVDRSAIPCSGWFGRPLLAARAADDRLWAAYTIMTMLAGRLSDYTGRKPMLMASLVLTVTASWVCPVQDDQRLARFSDDGRRWQGDFMAGFGGCRRRYGGHWGLREDHGNVYGCLRFWSKSRLSLQYIRHILGGSERRFCLITPC